MQRKNHALWRISREILKNEFEAEDAVQDAYVSTFTHLGDFRGERGESSLSTWLSRITVNEALRRLRRRHPAIRLFQRRSHQGKLDVRTRSRAESVSLDRAHHAGARGPAWSGGLRRARLPQNHEASLLSYLALPNLSNLWIKVRGNRFAPLTEGRFDTIGISVRRNGKSGEFDMRFAPLVQRVTGKGAGTWHIHFDAERQKAAGRDIIFMTVGDPDQAPPAAVIEATVGALRRGRTGYSPITGYPEVRGAIAARFAKRTGQPCAAENVVIVPGTQAGLFCALQCLAGPGDEVIVTEPMYATYEAVAGASGARLVNVPLRPQTGFHPDLDAMAKSITPATRGIWINSPHNPTGAVLTRDEIETIA